MPWQHEAIAEEEEGQAALKGDKDEVILDVEGGGDTGTWIAV